MKKETHVERSVQKCKTESVSNSRVTHKPQTNFTVIIHFFGIHLIEFNYVNNKI